MDEDNKEWYYTSGPDQAGPVSFEELKAKAAASELHPRQDMVWNTSMDEWVPAGQIDNLYEKRVTASASEGATASAAALQQEKAQPTEEAALWPGATRRWFILLVLLFPILWVVICLTFATFIGSGLSPGFQKFFMLIGLIVPVWVMIDTSLSRLSNLGMNKIWFLMNFVPVINLWVGYRTFACPAGYGKDTKMDPIGWFLAIIYWLFMVSLVAIGILVPTFFATALKDSNFMEKYETMRKQVEKTTGDHTVKPKKPVKPKPAPKPAPPPKPKPKPKPKPAP